MKRFSLKELESMLTLSVGQLDDLKFDNGHFRIWFSRCSKEDGEPLNNKVTIEQLKDGKWITIETYEAT